MPFDAYTNCPGGRDKKIKFCCPDMIKELEQLHQLFERKQHAACINLLDQLAEKHPNCACLDAARIQSLLADNKLPESYDVAQKFYNREPENPVAISDFASLAVYMGDPAKGLNLIIDALEKNDTNTLKVELINGLLTLGVAMASMGIVVTPIAIGQFLQFINSKEIAESGIRLTMQALANTNEPLIIRSLRIQTFCPESFVKKAEFQNAMGLINSGRWKKGLAALENLIEYAKDFPAILWNVAVIRLWFFDVDKALDTFRQYSEVENQPFENRADAAYIRMLFTNDALGDLVDIQTREYEITDPDSALEKLLSNGLFANTPFDQRQFQDPDSPPPKNLFALLDKVAVTASETKPTINNTPLAIANVLFFGRQTDKPARLFVVGLHAENLVQVDNAIRNAIGGTIGKVGEPQTVTQQSRTHLKAQAVLNFHSSIPFTAESEEEFLLDYYNNIFIPFVYDAPLGCLDGKSPAQVANDPAYSARLGGWIRYIEMFLATEVGAEVCNKICEHLKLPIPNTIRVPEPCPSGNGARQFLDSVPLWRWQRLEFEKMTTDMLNVAYRVCMNARDVRTQSRISEEVLSRPVASVPPQLRSGAYATLMSTAQAEHNFEEAVTWLERAMVEAREARQSPAVWKVMAISIYLGMGEPEKANSFLADVVQNHSNDETAMRLLQETLIKLGLMNPDGTPRNVSAREFAGEQHLATKQPTATTGGLWTPDGDAPKSGGGKLWTPD
ncbi:MAG: hypothetical protein LBU65_05415 [Planctomycetaceae bacterium]|jgi:tetratricopeptide (TPR) repeat protein|nr:hypothetical protein [Planctomycetaceae bacterium]